MRICAYCKDTGNLTREHVIPSWYIKKGASSDNNFFLAKAKGFIKADLVVKDVCKNCNSGPLSLLDDYGRNVYEKHFTQFHYRDEHVKFTYDYCNLIKWLVKLSYNSSRANGSDFEILGQYANMLITNKSIPEEIIVYCGLVSPSTIRDGEAHLAESDNNSMFEPDWFRVGVFRVAGFDSLNWSFRHVSINSYSFYLCLPKLSGVDVKTESALLRNAIRKETRFGYELCKSGTYQGKPVLDAFNSYDQQATSYPVAHELHSDTLIEKFRKDQSPMLNIEIERSEIENKNYSKIHPILDYLLSSKEVVMELKQKVEFSVSGYDTDPRFLYDIPEVKEYLKELNQYFPFWMFYQFEHGIWLKVLLICLNNTGNNEEVELDPDKAQNQINEWFISLNKLCHEFAIEESINREVSDNVFVVLKRTQWPPG